MHQQAHGQGTVTGSVLPSGQLLGRQAETAAVEELLAVGSAQVVGGAGSGVTSLLLRLTERWRDAGGAALVVDVHPWAREARPLTDQVDALLPHLRSPLVVVDDADAVPVGAVAHLARVVAAHGGHLLAGLHPGRLLPGTPEVTLVGLSREAVADLVERRAVEAGAEPPTTLVPSLAHAARGNPSHVEALLDADVLARLTALGVGVSDPGDLVPAFEAALPASCVERLGRLDDAGRLAVAVVAVAGPRAPGTLLDAAAGVDQLHQAREVGLLERDGEAHRFRHAVVRELVRGSMPPETRTEVAWRLAVASQAAGLTVAPPGALSPRG